MRHGFLASLAGLLLGVSVGLAQKPPPPKEAPPLPRKEGQPEPLPLMPEKVDKPEKTARNGLPTMMSGADVIADPGAGPDVYRGSDAGFWTPHGQLWTSVEFLLVRTKDPRALPVLVVGSAIIPPTEDDPGGETIRALGEGEPDFREFAGLRLSAGYWFEPERHTGVETSYFFLGKRSLDTRFLDTPRLFRPFINLATREVDPLVIASPGIAGGSISFALTSQAWGLETNLVKNVLYDPYLKCVRLDLICGLRYLDLKEDFQVERATSFNPDLTATPAFLAFQSNRIFEKESIRTHNSFYGAQIGASAKVIFFDCLVLDARAKIGAGVNQERLIIRGEQLRVRPDGTQTRAAGALLALPSNIGRFRREQFNYVPEISANLGFPINNHVGFYLGYTFVYWSKVARPGDQIDRTADASQIPNLPPPIPAPTGIGRPAVLFNQQHWWMQGLTIGLEFHW